MVSVTVTVTLSVTVDAAVHEDSAGLEEVLTAEVADFKVCETADEEEAAALVKACPLLAMDRVRLAEAEVELAEDKPAAEARLPTAEPTAPTTPSTTPAPRPMRSPRGA